MPCLMNISCLVCLSVVVQVSSNQCHSTYNVSPASFGFARTRSTGDIPDIDCLCGSKEACICILQVSSSLREKSVADQASSGGPLAGLLFLGSLRLRIFISIKAPRNRIAIFSSFHISMRKRLLLSSLLLILHCQKLVHLVRFQTFVGKFLIDYCLRYVSD